ncbi:MAG: glycoside hydrolase family 43 protein [Opitutales bacterium]
MPTLPDFQIRDPFVLTDPATGLYRLYGTTALGGPEDARQGFVVRQSRDLQIWSEPHAVLPRTAGPVNADYYWAPEVHAYAGRWYLFATFGHGLSLLKPRARHTSIFGSDSPDGPFVPHSNGPVTPLGWLGIDGTLYCDPAGRPWLVFCREWVQTRIGEIHALPLSDDLRRPAGTARLLFRASEAPWSLAQKSELGDGYHVTDGPWLHRTAKGKLLLLWSSFGAGGYVTGVAHSPTGDICGPWVQAAEPLFARDGGHAMTFRALDGRLLLALHSPNRPMAERARLLPLRETADGLQLA